ncbi:MAG: hypothetical protein ACI4HI_02725 [Lachnospiraceae bacterium]
MKNKTIFTTNLKKCIFTILLALLLGAGFLTNTIPQPSHMPLAIGIAHYLY